jgi:Tfp pilus assembly protein FimV
MIVTRQRKKRFPWKRLLVPAVLLAVIGLALWWAPSRGWIANETAPVWKPVAAPFDAVAQQKALAESSKQAAALESQLADARAQIADRDKQISRLQTQLSDAQQQAVDGPSPAPAATASAAPGQNGSDLAQQATPDMRRTAAEWASMDSESAAKVVQKLPIEYVARVFAVMSPDAAGAILENLPASYAAQLTQDHPELKR